MKRKLFYDEKLIFIKIIYQKKQSYNFQLKLLYEIQVPTFDVIDGIVHSNSVV